MIDLKPIALNYFYLFSCKNLDALSKMFALESKLHDWENHAEGKDNVVAVYEKIFNSVNTIAVTPRAVYQDNHTVVAELLITINGQEQILVTDVITFENDKITNVRAYKG